MYVVRAMLGHEVAMLFLALTCSALLSFSEDQQWSAFGPVTLAAFSAAAPGTSPIEPEDPGMQGSMGIWEFMLVSLEV